MANHFSNKVKRKTGGSSLSLVAAIGLGVVLVVLFFAVIYSQQFTHQKEAQTAIDSAALAVAKEISLVSVSDPNLGIVGVSDQFQALGPQQAPIYGINTLVGRARLDAVISNQLNNNDMKLLANRDSLAVLQAAKSLRTALVLDGNGVLKYSAPSGAVARNLKQIAAQAYNANPTKALNSPDILPADVTVEIGYLNNAAAGLTDIPIPSPNNMSLGVDNDNFSGQVGGTRFYRAGVAAAVPGIGGQYIFSAISRQQRLVDRHAFVTAAPDPNLVPTVARVTIRQQVNRKNPQSGATLTTNAAGQIEVAAATAGGERVPTTAGVFRLEFPQGIPQDASQGNNFRTIRAIMDAGKTAWTGDGNFFTAKNGPFPGSGTIVPTSFPSGSDPNLNPVKAATPSALVSYYVYDWLRNDCLRPNVQAVINALNNPLRTASNPSAVQVSDASKSIFDQAGEIFIQKAWADVPGTAAQCKRIWGGIFALIPNSTKAMARGNDPRSLNNFDLEPNAYLDQAYVFRMQGSTPQQLAFAPGQTLAIGMNEDTGCPTTVNGEPISEALDLREDINASQNLASVSYDAGAEVQDDSLAEQKRLTPLMNAQIAEVNKINAQIAPIDQQLARLPNGAARNALLAVRAGLVAQRVPYDNEYARLLALFNEEGRKIDRAAVVMANSIEIISAISGVAPYTAPKGFPGLINNMRAVSSLGIDRVIPADPSSTAQPRQYQLAGSINYWPPQTAATIAQIVGSGKSPSGQLPQAPGDENWLGNPRIFTGALETLSTGVVETAPGRVQQITCPPSVRPSSQTRNFEMLSVGDSSLNGAGAVMFTTSNNAPQNGTTAVQPYDFSKIGTYRSGVFENVTGVSALLEGNSQYQALNVYEVKTKCDRDPDKGRFTVLWSVMAQDNGNNLSNPAVDVRNEATPGNKLDCGRANTTGDANQKVCDNEVIRIQFTSPSPYIDALPVLPNPAPPKKPGNAPPMPATPPPPPPQPPRSSH